jgi:hypothetical protein
MDGRVRTGRNIAGWHEENHPPQVSASRFDATFDAPAPIFDATLARAVTPRLLSSMRFTWTTHRRSRLTTRSHRATKIERARRCTICICQQRHRSPDCLRLK